MPKISNWGDSNEPWGQQKNAFGQTQKQQEMSKATSPKASNAPNDSWKGPEVQKQQTQVATDRNITGQDRGGYKAEEVSAEGKKKEQEKSQFARERVEKLVNKIGPAGFQVQAQMNKVLNPNAVLSDSQSVGFDEQKGHQISGSLEADTDAMAANTMGEIDDLEGVMKSSGLFGEDETGTLQERSMRDLLSEEAQQVAERNPEEVRQVSELLRLADKLQLLSEKGKANSTEARQLKAQILAMDDQGVVEGLYQAQQDYETFVKGEGLEFTGDQAFKTVGPKDLLNLGLDEIKMEIEKALTTESGLFSGEYATVLRQEVDELTSKFRQSAEIQMQGESAFQQGAADVLNSFRDRLTVEESAYSDMFDQAAEGFGESLTADSELLKAIPLEEAEKLMTLRERGAESGYLAMAYLSSLGNGDFVAGVAEALKQNILPPDVAEAFSTFLDSEDAEGVKSQGKISFWLESMSKGLPITYNGKNINLNGTQKAMVIKAAQTGNTDRIEAIFKQSMKEINVDIGGIINSLDGIDKNSMGKVVSDTIDQLEEGTKNFAHSQTEEGLKALLGYNDRDWSALSTEDRAKIIADAARERGPKLFNDIFTQLQVSNENLRDDVMKNLGIEQATVKENQKLLEELLAKKKTYDETNKSGMEKTLQQLQEFGATSSERAKLHVKTIAADPQVQTLVMAGRVSVPTVKVAGMYSFILDRLKHMESDNRLQPLRKTFVDKVNNMLYVNSGGRIGSNRGESTIQMTMENILLKDSGLAQQVIGEWEMLFAGGGLNDYVRDNLQQENDANGLFANYLEEMITEVKGRIQKGENKTEVLTNLGNGVVDPKEMVRIAHGVVTGMIKGGMRGFDGDSKRLTIAQKQDAVSKHQFVPKVGNNPFEDANDDGLGELGREKFFNPAEEETIAREANIYTQGNLREWIQNLSSETNRSAIISKMRDNNTLLGAGMTRSLSNGAKILNSADPTFAVLQQAGGPSKEELGKYMELAFGDDIASRDVWYKQTIAPILAVAKETVLRLSQQLASGGNTINKNQQGLPMEQYPNPANERPGPANYNDLLQ